MKRLLLMALLVTASTAHAEKWLEWKNKAGGKIVLTAEACPDRPALRRMYASAPNSTTLFGCWGVLANEIHVRYDDGDAYTYPMESFQLIDTEQKK